MNKIFNFSAGPAVLPQAVLQEAQAELLNWRGSGMSVMEMSHRGAEFEQIIADAEQDLRELLNIPQNYKVLFLQGGATLQFSALPLNLLGDREAIDLVLTGSWSKAASKEAARFAKVHIAASSENDGFNHIPDVASWQLHDDAAYLHFVSNETIGGVQFHDFSTLPKDRTLVCDMSSDFLSRPLDVSQFGVIFAGAQKNIGPAGLTLVIVRDDLLGKAKAQTPNVMNYQSMADAGSMLNTPPTFAIYMAGLVFRWLKNLGGLAAIEKMNAEKAALLYRAIDESGGFYRCPVAQDCRSLMNIPFRLPSEDLEKQFLQAAKNAGLIQLKGHRSVGGIRASIYNAMPQEGVAALVDLMQTFQKQQG